MIWNSIPAMTAFDLLIIAATIYGIWCCRLIDPGRQAFASRGGRRSSGLRLIAIGLLAVCSFYFVDFILMHVLRAARSEEDAMAFMDALHRNASWPVVLFAVVTITTGSVEVLGELREREAKVRCLVESNVIGVFIWHIDGRIIDANEAFLSILGYDRDDLVSGRLRWTELTPADPHDADDRRVAALKARETAKPSEKEYLHKKGSCVPVLVGSALFEETHDEGVAFVLDLTDRKRAERKARESERRFHEAQMELAHANRVVTLGHLSASIAHEINQPIAAAANNASAALRWLGKRPPDLEKARQSLNRIVANSNRASEVIRRMRALLKKAPLRKEEVEINQVICEVVALTCGEASANEVSVQTQLAESVPLVHGDRVQLQQVILNLVMNAVEAMSSVQEGSRELTISSGETPGAGLLVVVQDSGPGLPVASLELVFDAFYTTKPGGLGIGLSISRSIIDSHGGRLWATPNIPKGTIFQFTLPTPVCRDHRRGRPRS